MKKFFDPKSIAIIGASNNPKKIGNTIVRNLLKYGYSGKIYPINLKEKKILGKKAYPSIRQIKGAVDVAIIVIPAPLVTETLKDCGKKKVRRVIIISSGFSEIGSDGARREKQLQEIAKANGILILGPNCLGLLNSQNGLNASFAAGMIRPGNVGLFSQSGALCSALMDWAENVGIGFSKLVSIGNKLGVEENLMLEYFSNDPDTKVILGYIEGLKEGRRFIEKAKKVSLKKPIILLKPGRSKKSQRAISSHTGALAGDDKVVTEAFREANIIRADSLEELFHVAMLFSWQPTMKGNRLGIISNAGGLGVITADLIENTALTLPEIENRTKKVLVQHMPESVSEQNPLDIVGDALAKRYSDGLQAMAADKNIDAILVILTPQTVTEIAETARVITKISKETKKTIVASFVGGKRVEKGIKILYQNHVPTYLFPRQAIMALHKMAEYSLRKESIQKGESRVVYKKIYLPLEKYTKYQNYFQELKKGGRNQQLSLTVAEELLQLYEIPVASSVFVKNKEELKQKVSKIIFPSAAKVDSPSVIHKTDVGGVVLNINSQSEALRAFDTIQKNVEKAVPNAPINGILFQQMLTHRLEIIIGGKRDSQFGPIIIFGLGGIFVNVFKDVAFRLAPVGQGEAKKMIHEVIFSPIIQGIRGQEPYDEQAIIECINRVSQMMLDFKEIEEIDLNPALVGKNKQGLYAVDFRIIV